VDDSPNPAARSATIREVARRSVERNIVAVHDFEEPLYSASAREMPGRFCFDALVPYTGVLWKGDRVDRAARRGLKALNRAYAGMAGCRADVAEEWVKAAEAALAAVMRSDRC
jgi:hypothetical protein